MKKHQGDLLITKSNQNNFKDLVEVSGYVDVSKNATFTAPKLVEVSGSVYVRENATFTAPKLEKSGYVDVSKNATFTAPKLEKSGYVDVSKNATFTAPKLEKSGYVDVSKNATFTAPKLEKSGYVDVSKNATFTAPKLEKSGYVDVSKNATFTAPKLEKSGYVDVSKNATFTAPSLKIQKNIAKFNNKNHNILFKDGIQFFSAATRTSKGIRIFSGHLKIWIENGKVKTQPGFLVQKECFFTHGETLKSAISDLHFKIASERIKNEPINEDSDITVMHYRIVTGACDVGCRNFMERNNIPYVVEAGKTVEKEPIKAKDLLLILQKENAYGYERFKSLLTLETSQL